MSREPSRTECNTCNGSGDASSTRTCTRCDGNGWVSGWLGGEKTCPNCDGSGKVSCSDKKCSDCDGKGYKVVMTTTRRPSGKLYSDPYSGKSYSKSEWDDKEAFDQTMRDNPGW